MSKFDYLIARRIDEILSIKKMTIVDTCEKANIAYQNIQDFMDGKRKRINYETILKLCKVWGITISMFFDTENFDILS